MFQKFQISRFLFALPIDFYCGNFGQKDAGRLHEKFQVPIQGNISVHGPVGGDLDLLEHNFIVSSLLNIKGGFTACPVQLLNL